ncbi:hypothetical protein [Oryzicola mucosus]|uniref:Uncharacterized protein n=1 Tax=Oryzicola mucosus TaxID=2767425 RepID=A0A8J6Q3L0_9HYPH|nr:hypothetical protein [Oryzicola mucosus]MBD0415505.1 hypothetical protein [Oryzicola mucosus]
MFRTLVLAAAGYVIYRIAEENKLLPAEGGFLSSGTHNPARLDAMANSNQNLNRTNSEMHARTEEPEDIEEQLDTGLEDSFPASDPLSVTSTTTAGGAEDIVGTDEVLRRQREEREKSNRS